MKWCRSRTPQWKTAPSSNGKRTILDAMGLLKVDVLALGMLCRASRAPSIFCNRTMAKSRRSLLNRTRTLPPINMIQRADTIGVFQIESRAQMSMLPRLRARKSSTISSLKSRSSGLARSRAAMVHPYLHGDEKARIRLPIPRPFLKRFYPRPWCAALPGTAPCASPSMGPN